MVAGNFWAHPCFPQDLHAYFEGLRVDSFISHEHPLLLSSILLAPAAMTNWSRPELVAHLTYLIFYFLLIASTYFLARPLIRLAWMAAILIAVSPVVFLSSHTVMSDLPSAALIYFALALASLPSPSSLTNFLAGLSCAGAVMLAYQSLLFVPVVYWAARKHRPGRTLIWALPFVALFAYGAINSHYFGRFIWWDLFAFWYQQPASAPGSAHVLPRC